jgi:hypothetical protein
MAFIYPCWVRTFKRILRPHPFLIFLIAFLIFVILGFMTRTYVGPYQGDKPTVVNPRNSNAIAKSFEFL